MSARSEVVKSIIETVEEMRQTIFIPNPKTRGKTSTGNMALTALKYKIRGDLVDIYIDPKVAPYCYYTDEPWVSPRWNGKKNPNEGWWDRFCQEFCRRLAIKLRGDLK